MPLESILTEHTGGDHGRANFVITVPHATNALPHWLESAEPTNSWQFLKGRHNAFDRGAADLADALATKLGASVIKGTVSRLVIDLNREANDRNAILTSAAGRTVEFNAAPLAKDIAARRRIHREFHEQVAAVLSNPKTILIDLHSFDRFGDGTTYRDVDIGICAPGDKTFALEVLRTMQSMPASQHSETPRLKVRLDEPYSADHPGAYVARRHADMRRPSIVIEVCDDILGDPGDVTYTAGVLQTAIATTAQAVVVNQKRRNTDNV